MAQAKQQTPRRGEKIDLKWQTPKHRPNEAAMQKGQLGQNHRAGQRTEPAAEPRKPQE